MTDENDDLEFVLPRTYEIVVRRGKTDPDLVWIEQPSIDGDPDNSIVVHLNQVDDLIAILQQFLMKEQERVWSVKKNKECPMLLDPA